MEKWNYYQPCDSIISQLSAYLGVGGGRNTMNEKSSPWFLWMRANQAVTT